MRMCGICALASQCTGPLLQMGRELRAQHKSTNRGVFLFHKTLPEAASTFVIKRRFPPQVSFIGVTFPPRRPMLELLLARSNLGHALLRSPGLALCHIEIKERAIKGCVACLSLHSAIPMRINGGYGYMNEAINDQPFETGNLIMAWSHLHNGETQLLTSKQRHHGTKRCYEIYDTRKCPLWCP